jgi:uncharacterized protein (TIGR02145 family)
LVKNLKIIVKTVKDILIFIFCFATGLTLSSQNSVKHCGDTITLSFEESLGTVSFVSDQTWTIEGRGITQIWSDAVQATGCQKFLRRFSGDAGDALYLADCRYNPDRTGSFFSWCAVANYGSSLCPEPWRVPTAEDFCNLDKILFNSNMCYSRKKTSEQAGEAFIDIWGGTFSGASGSRGNLYFQDEKSFYWSQTEYNSSYAYHLTFDIQGNVISQNIDNLKSLGFLLRCIR